MRWVRPDFTTVLNCALLLAQRLGQVLERRDQVGGDRRASAATWMADGNTSLDDWRGVDVVVGVHRRGPAARTARSASTSFMFMFDEVPDPVWYTSTGNWSSQPPVGHLGGGVVRWPSATCLSTDLQPGVGQGRRRP